MPTSKEVRPMHEYMLNALERLILKEAERKAAARERERNACNGRGCCHSEANAKPQQAEACAPPPQQPSGPQADTSHWEFNASKAVLPDGNQFVPMNHFEWYEFCYRTPDGEYRTVRVHNPIALIKGVPGQCCGVITADGLSHRIPERGQSEIATTAKLRDPWRTDIAKAVAAAKSQQ